MPGVAGIYAAADLDLARTSPRAERRAFARPILATTPFASSVTIAVVLAETGRRQSMPPRRC
jgi:hypothetical protein